MVVEATHIVVLGKRRQGLSQRKEQRDSFLFGKWAFDLGTAYSAHVYQSTSVRGAGLSSGGICLFCLRFYSNSATRTVDDEGLKRAVWNSGLWGLADHERYRLPPSAYNAT